MRVLIVNTAERRGGAAIAASRLSDALQQAGMEVTMLVRDRDSDSSRVNTVSQGWRAWCKFLWERWVIMLHNRLSRKNLFKVSIANTGFDITRHPEFCRADVVHLHWINQGMLSLGDIEKILDSGKRIVWTLHDMWPCTGICHMPYDCKAYLQHCHDCPWLAYPAPHDLSDRVFRRKKKIYDAALPHFSIVTVSSWLAQRVSESALLGNKPIDVIPNTISPKRFELLERGESRRRIGLQDEPYVLLFGAARIDDPIKGFHFLVEAVECLLRRGRYQRNELHLLLFGNVRNQTMVEQLPIVHTAFGAVSDPHLISTLYSAANVVLSTSFYETFGQTVAEAQICGCLPLAFDGSGQTDIITHKQNGYLARYLDVESLADGLEWCFARSINIDRRKLRADVLRRFAPEVVAQRYLDVYSRPQ